MSPCIRGLRTQDPYILKEHTELYKILKFRVNWANIEQDTAIQKVKNLLTNVWIAVLDLCVTSTTTMHVRTAKALFYVIVHKVYCVYPIKLTYLKSCVLYTHV